MYCKKCGTELPEGMNFCTKCGTPVDKSTATPARDGKTTALTDSPAPTPAVQQQPEKPMQPQPQKPSPTPPVQQKSVEKAQTPKKGGAVAYIALVASIAALVIAVVGGFVLPSMNQNGGGPRAVQAGTATISIKAGEQSGKTKILNENTPYIVVATSVGGDTTFSDVMFNTSSGELFMSAGKKMDKDVERSVYWVAYEK